MCFRLKSLDDLNNSGYCLYGKLVSKAEINKLSDDEKNKLNERTEKTLKNTISFEYYLKENNLKMNLYSFKKYIAKYFKNEFIQVVSFSTEKLHSLLLYDLMHWYGCNEIGNENAKKLMFNKLNSYYTNMGSVLNCIVGCDKNYIAKDLLNINDKKAIDYFNYITQHSYKLNLETSGSFKDIELLRRKMIKSNLNN